MLPVLLIGLPLPLTVPACDIFKQNKNTMVQISHFLNVYFLPHCGQVNNCKYKNNGIVLPYGELTQIYYI